MCLWVSTEDPTHRLGTPFIEKVKKNRGMSEKEREPSCWCGEIGWGGILPHSNGSEFLGMCSGALYLGTGVTSMHS